MRRRHSIVVLAAGKAQVFFYLIVMLTVLSSLHATEKGTCRAYADETGFQLLSTLIPNLHEAHIRYKKNRITGVFNIAGRYTTMGATSFSELIEKVLQKEAEYREYIRQNKKSKHNEK